MLKSTDPFLPPAQTKLLKFLDDKGEVPAHEVIARTLNWQPAKVKLELKGLCAKRLLNPIEARIEDEWGYSWRAVDYVQADGTPIL